MKKKITPKEIWEVIKNAFSGFSEDKVTKLSASLAYYTIFSLGPLLIVILSLCGLFFEREAIEGTVYTQLQNFIGADAAKEIEQIIKNASIGDKGSVALIIGLITLLLGATSVFAEMQDSINTIWNLKPKPKKGMLLMLKNRLLSFGLIASLGFLMLVSLGVTALIEGLSGKLKGYFPDIAVIVIYIINLVITLAIVSALFAIMFKVLPDALLKWKDVLPGAIVTAILFMIGKFAISVYISKANIGSTYGAAGSLVILLLWIYYSSIIVYFGAEFTKAYAVKYRPAIFPEEYSVIANEVEVEGGKTSIQQAEKDKKQMEQKSKSNRR